MNKLLASSSTLEGILKLAAQYKCGFNAKISEPHGGCIEVQYKRTEIIDGEIVKSLYWKSFPDLKIVSKGSRFRLESKAA
jgi:hypothetical protein